MASIKFSDLEIATLSLLHNNAMLYCSGISLLQLFVSITFQISSHFIRISFDIAISKNINGLTLAFYGNMKRGPESFEGMASHGAEMKRSRGGNKIEVRILIPSKIAGSIIGKSGANIQQSVSYTHLTLPTKA